VPEDLRVTERARRGRGGRRPRLWASGVVARQAPGLAQRPGLDPISLRAQKASEAAALLLELQGAHRGVLSGPSIKRRGASAHLIWGLGWLGVGTRMSGELTSADPLGPSHDDPRRDVGDSERNDLRRVGGPAHRRLTDLEDPATATVPLKPGRRIDSATGARRILISLAFFGCLLAACGSGHSASASQSICNDRTQLRNAVSTVAGDLRSGNFSKAKDELPAVRDALNSLSQSAQELKAQVSQTLRSPIDNLNSAVANLKDSKSLSDLLSGIDSIGSQVDAISSQIGDTLKCS
jgi:hypothetical protein